MKRAQQARNAARAYAEGNALSSINAARRVAAGLDVLRATDADKALLTPHYAKLPLSTLRDYQENNETAGALIDQGREPFLVNREALAFDMHPFIEVWDVEALPFMSGHSRHFKKPGTQVMTSTQRGDALLPLDALLVWR
ncbi:MAG: hypothetical protein GAK28_04323 [Luteibacter sp.]|uniref:hypothetical protein n=1 Tax=Luteibacter sp. TaxID=1886636 RepID=UPI0013840D6F|nr:hypothetical protein [Luteibacter sp.]KAF1003860.1 MAG: hypothetical protein GAK28_04323 [Luteibacter sp.]